MSRDNRQPANEVSVIKLETLPTADLEPLLAESRAQGFEFLDRLVAEYLSGVNRFAGPNEALFGVYHNKRMIAIGGLNNDPYLPTDDVGRVRHVYVLAAWRNQGIGTRLMRRIVEEARPHYARLLTLRTFSEQADGFYRALGFRATDEVETATHC